MAVQSTDADMVDVGETAPDFTAPLANGEVSEFTLSERVQEAAPVVLAFFPGAFTSVCSHELNTFQDRLEELHDHGAGIYGISTDLPFAQNAFRDDLGLEFDLVSDTSGDIAADYDVLGEFPHIGLDAVAKRAVFVLDADRTVTYAWVTDDASVEPNYDEVLEAVADAA